MLWPNGALCLVVATVGDFSKGRAAMGMMGYALLVIAMPFLAFLFSHRLAKVLGIIVLLAFAVTMLWLAFQPATPAKNPAIYQAAAIALGVLLFAGIGLPLWRKRSRPGA